MTLSVSNKELSDAIDKVKESARDACELNWTHFFLFYLSEPKY